MITSLTGRTRHLYNKLINREVGLYLNGYTAFRLKKIDGLGPVKNHVTTVATPLEPGGVFLSSKAEERNLVLTVEFAMENAEGSTVAELRQNLYSVFSPGNKIDIIIEDNELGTLTIDGRVETTEPTIFTQDPTVMISIICPYPYFKLVAPRTVYVVPPGNFPMFNVPFSSNVPTGFVFEADVAIDNDYFLLHGEPRINTNYIGLSGFQLLVGDHIRLSTVKGDRSATYIRSASTQSVLGYLTGSLSDTKLVDGDNYFRLNEHSRLSNVKFSYDRFYNGL